MTNELKVFSYIGLDVRTVLINGQPRFVLADVCRALGLSTPAKVADRLDIDEKGMNQIPTLGGTQTMATVTESGLYSVILRSDKPAAKEFRRWITGVVLPEIRQKGVYSLIPTKPAEPELPTDFLSALKALVAEVEQTTELRAELAEVTPRADAWDALASAEGDYSVGDAAKILMRAGIPTGPTRLFQQLAELKWTYRGGDGAWHVYAERADKGYLAEKPQFHFHPGNGKRVIDPPQVRVTVKGLERLRQRLHIGSLKAVTA